MQAADGTDLAVDRIWRAFRIVCTALQSFKAVKDRNKAVADAEEFMALPKHRAYVHRWRGWGLLLSGLLHAVRSDLYGYLGVDSGAASAKKRKPKGSSGSSKSQPPKLAWWLNLRNQFGSAHGEHGPTLHLDPNGRDVVAQLFEFALTVINHADGHRAGADELRTLGEMERAAWQTIELLVSYRVYCAVLEKKQLQEVLELALAAIDHDGARQNTFPLAGSKDFSLLASVIHLVMKHAPYDLHDWLPKLMPFFGEWFTRLDEKTSSTPQHDIAPQLIELVTDVGRAYFTFVGPLLLTRGNPLLQYVKRSFKYARQHWRSKLSEFVTLYFELFEYHADNVELVGELEPATLLRDAKALLSIFLDTSMLQSVSMLSHSSAGIASSASATSVGTSEVANAVLESNAVSFFVCAADTVFTHDRLLQRISDESRPPLLKDTHKDNDVVMDDPVVSVKRSLEATVPMAWEQLLDQIIGSSSNDEVSSASASTALTQMREHYALQAQQQKQARLLGRRHAARMLILTAVLRRHGGFYAGDRIGDLVGLMEYITQTLESKELGKHHVIALHLLVHLAQLSQSYPDLKSDLFEDYWTKVWNTILRRDLPFATEISVIAPRDGVGELAAIVLNYCVSLSLVSRPTIACSSTQLWALYHQGSSSSSNCVIPSSSTSSASVLFLASLMRVVQPPSNVETRQFDGHLSEDGNNRDSRLQVLSAVFDHLQASLLFEERKPLDASWEKNFRVIGVLPAVYATALGCFLGLAPPAEIAASLLCLEMEPSLSRAFSGSERTERESGVGPELEGFGVHFALQEWGLWWQQKTASFVKSDRRGHHPDQFSELVRLYRLSHSVLDSANPAGGTRGDWEKAKGFFRLEIPDRLTKRTKSDLSCEPIVVAMIIARAAIRSGDLPVTTPMESVESSIREIMAKFTDLLDDLANKLSSIETDSPKMLTQLNSVMTVGLTLGCIYSQAKDVPPQSHATNRKSVTSVICLLLQKFLVVLADYFSATAVDHARHTAMAASIITQQLMQLHSFILIVQGRSSLQNVQHPCADPVNLRIPSELRPAIRKVIAALEASLELVVMDASNNVASQPPSSLHNRSRSRDEQGTASRSFSSTPTNSTPPTSISWDWDSHLTQPIANSVVRSRAAVDEDDDSDMDVMISTTRTSYRVSHAPQILSLWSLRVILLLKKESGLKAVRKYALELDFTPDFLIAIASMLCGISGCESLEVIVKILETAQEEVNRGSRRGGTNGNPAAALLFSSEMLCILRRCASVYEHRKRSHKEEIPEILLTTARRFVDAEQRMNLQEQLLVVRRNDIKTLEVLFRLNTDTFGDFIDLAMKYLVDIDISVRFASVKSLQTLFYMYPDGCEQVFRDLYHFLAQCLPPSVRQLHGTSSSGQDDLAIPAGTAETCVIALATLFVCACSSPSVVPETLLVFMRLAVNVDVPAYSRSRMLERWLGELAAWYEYPSIGRMVGDHFCFLWSQHITAVTGGESWFELEKHQKQGGTTQRVCGQKFLDAFPAALVLQNGGSQVQRRDCAELFAKHVDVILPTAVLYGVARGDVAADGLHFPLVEELSQALLCRRPPNDSDQGEQQLQQRLSSLVEEQLITDLFALSFVLHASVPSSSSSSSSAAAVENVGSVMLTLAEDKATTHALTISHLGHVVMKMARFAVWDIVGNTRKSGSDGVETAAGGEQWLHAMKTMKNKYSGFDWSRMNLAELLTDFHELLLTATYSEPLASRAINCFCFFVNEIKEAVSSEATKNSVLLQHLLLHVLFETVKNVKRRDKQASHKLSFLVREMCDHLMRNCTDAFGKYLNFVVQEIADILVRASRKSDALFLDSDDKANLEWVIFAICNNMASGLGKFAVSVDAVPAGVAACLDKLNSMLSASNGRAQKDSTSSRRKSLEPLVARPIDVASGPVSYEQAIAHIDQFVQRANQVGERFYQPRTLAIGACVLSPSGQDTSVTDVAGMSSQLLHIREQVRVLQDAQRNHEGNVEAEEDTREAASAQRAVLAKLTRTLFTLSTQYENMTTLPDSASVGNILLTIADTLGEIGIWDAHDFELSPGQDGDELSRLYQRHFRRGALRETRGTFQVEMHEHLLRFLSSLLFESGGHSRISPEVLHEALNSLKTVLRLDEGTKALVRSKDHELKTFLEPFVQASPSNWSLVPPTEQDGVSLVTLSRLRMLWRNFESSSFDEWICALTDAMGGRCADPVLRSCAPLARYRVDMAIFMFPYVLWATLKTSKRDPKTAAMVNASIQNITSSAASTTSARRVIQLVIHSINFLRETEKAVFVETNGQQVSRDGSTPTKKRTSTSDPKTPSPAPSTSQSVLRSQKKGGENSLSDRLAYTCLVDINLLDLAEAAIRVKMPYSAMQFVEMWIEAWHGGVMPAQSISPGATKDTVEAEARVRSILVDAYSLDDDVDAIYGVNDGRTFASQMVTYNREGSFAQVLPLYDVALRFDTTGSSTQFVEGSLHAFNRLGYQGVLHQYLNALAGKGPNTANIQEHRFELAWKSLQWNSVELGGSSATPTQSSRLDDGERPYMHQRTLYLTLRAMAHRDAGQLTKLTGFTKQQALTSARTSLFGFESTRESFEVLMRLQSIRIIEECAKMMENQHAPSMHEQFETWHKLHRHQSKSIFDVTERLLSLEEALVQIVDLPLPGSTLARIYLSQSKASRQAGRVAMAYEAITKLEQLHSRGDLEVYDQAAWKMEHAKLLWSQKETRSAIWIAKQLESELQKRVDEAAPESDRTRLRMQHVASLTLTGKWIASQRSENSQVILQDYLQRATEIVDSTSARELKATPSGIQDAAKAHVTLADYMAEMYAQVATRISSREWLAGKRVAEARQRELAECLAMSETKQLENRAHIHALNKEVMHDYEERTKVESSVDQFLTGALRSFGKALALSAKSELAVVFRVLALWFSNQMKAGINRVVRELIDSVPSYKFVPLSYQIISRVGNTPTSGSAARSDGDGAFLFEHVLSIMVLKLCEQHPHHALVQLIALKNSGDVEGKGATEFRANVGDAKSEGAKKYLEKLRKGPQGELLESLDVLSNAYIQLALFDTREYHKLGKKIPLSDIKITSLGGGVVQFDHCLRDRSRRSASGGSSRAAMPAVMTSSITPRPDMDYSGVSRVLSFDKEFSITDSGIHRPKIIYCFGSDGRRFKQLVKGKDDTRQDLVIEQVFDSVNQFLKEDQNTRKRNLRLRTYKVVPLSPIAGVLEWVDKTMAWGSYLVSRAAKRLSAHERYHPNEWKHAECRMYLKNQPDKYAAYRTIEEHFTPVFHHFFLEKFPDAAMWYKRRLAFVQSAAVTSIVGYILGIGDRHSQNILIHEETAELVHIDFGVVFDQGMALLTPETVPFRLTRDLVDGMGVSGVEGVFTRCCEATLQLLRKKSASVVTLLEVFVHDPLYRWTLSPLKALKIQEEGTSARPASRSNGSETDGNSDASNAGVGGGNNDAAARALIRVRQKLEGYEDPNGNALSIEGQVKQLISVAQDPRNLCALFPGWAPWL